MIRMNNRTIAILILVLFSVSHFLPTLSMAQDPCKDLKEKVKEWEGKYRDAQRNLTNLREEGYLPSMTRNGWRGFLIGGVIGWAAGPGAGPVALVGALSGMAWGALAHYDKIVAAEKEVTYARNTLNSYLYRLQKCESENSSSSNPNCTICYGSGACTVCNNSN